MYFQKRGHGYSFVYYDPERKKNVRLTQDLTPKIRSEEEAAAYCREWNEKHRTSSIIIEEKLQWMKLAPFFVQLLSIFEKSRKEEAEFSWQTYCYYLKYYAFTFFIDIKGLVDLNLWYREFENFRDYLQQERSIRLMDPNRNTLAYSTMNAVIKALNSFLSTMFRRTYINHLHKCRLFPRSKLPQKSDECVISPTEQKQMYLALKLVSRISSQMFWVSLQTGVRLNELVGLSLGDLYAGRPEDPVLVSTLDQFSLKTYGFIMLESQPAQKYKPRDDQGHVPRKPLKGKKKISAKNARTIPLLDVECFNILVELWNVQRELYETRIYGEDPKNYLLFHDYPANHYRMHFMQVQKELGIGRSFTPHDTRHTYSTWLAEKTGGNFNLCQLILGHSSLDTTMAYVHMGARIQHRMKAKFQLKTAMTPIDVPSNVFPLFLPMEKEKRG